LVKSKPQASSSQYPTSKITTAKWTGVVAQVIEHLVCKGLPSLEAQNPEFNHSPTKFINKNEIDWKKSMKMEGEPTQKTEKVNTKEKYLRTGFRFGIKVKNICQRTLLGEGNSQV
jgi:hypothetical protein